MHLFHREMNSIVLKAAIVILIFSGLCHLTIVSDAASQPSEWCLANAGQTPYQSALRFLNSSRIDEQGLDGIVEALFLRMGCRRMASGNQSVCTEVNKICSIRSMKAPRWKRSIIYRLCLTVHAWVSSSSQIDGGGTGSSTIRGPAWCWVIRWHWVPGKSRLRDVIEAIYYTV